MKIINFIIILFIIILGITFAILNAESVTVHYYIGIKQLPLSFVMAITLSIGITIGLLIMGLITLRLKTEKHYLKKRLKVAEQEIENLRTIPIKDEH